MDLEARIKLLKNLEENQKMIIHNIGELISNLNKVDMHLVKTKERLGVVERKLSKLETEGAIYSYTWNRNEDRFKIIEEQLNIKWLIPPVPSGHPNYEYHKNKLKV